MPLLRAPPVADPVSTEFPDPGVLPWKVLGAHALPLRSPLHSTLSPFSVSSCHYITLHSSRAP